MNGRRARVSDRAVVRYLEHRLNMDVDAIRARILTPLVKEAIQAGASRVKVDGLEFAVGDDGTIATIVDPSTAPEGAAPNNRGHSYRGGARGKRDGTGEGYRRQSRRLTPDELEALDE